MVDVRSLIHLVERHAIAARWVFDGSTLESFGRQGPVLLSLTGKNLQPLRDVLALCQRKPALSLLRPRQSIEELVVVLQWIAWMETADGADPLHCRFADTRVTPALLNALRPEQHEQLAWAIRQWCWSDRMGRALTCQSFDAHPAKMPQPGDRFNLDSSQFTAMLMSAEPDMVFQMLHEKMPDILPEQDDGGTIHRRLSAMIAAARKRGLEDLPDLFQFVVLGLSTHDAFHETPALQPLWQERADTKARFADWMHSWPEHIWASLDCHHQPTV